MCHLFESVDLFIKLVNWSGKRTRKWNVADNTSLFTHKTVRKFGQKHDFAKFHSKRKHQVFNIYKNCYGGGEPTLWTSYGCNMRVWTRKTQNSPALLAIPWFWAFFRWLFNKMEHLVNKRSTLICWLKLSSSKRSHFKLQKTYLPFFHTTDTFFNIFIFRFGGR